MCLSLAIGALLGWRNERPELVMAGVLAGDSFVHLLMPDLVIPFAGLVAMWSLAKWRAPKISLGGLAGLLAVSAINFFSTTVEDAVFTMVIAVCVSLGEAARNRRTAIDEATRRAVSHEQARIARELHDVIAHSVSVIVVQASAASCSRC